MRRVSAFLALALLACCGGTALAALRRQPPRERLSTMPSGEYEVKFEGGINVTMSDGVQLHVDGYVPIPRDNTTRFPIVIFPNSWSMPIFEYILKTLNLAKDGYIAVEYETRGWYNSGGEIDGCGPRDLADASTILDYVANRSDWQPDTTAIAFGGISYGAGISLSMAGYDKRVKTALVMSGWANITDMIIPDGTPNKVWGGLLELLGKLVGHMSPQLNQLYDDAMHHRNMSFIESFCAPRSPGRFLDVFNERKVPLFISHNRLDRLFRSEWALELYSKLTYPEKFVMINQGVHAEAEGFGLFDLGHNRIWSYARQWLDHYLMGRTTDITQMSPVQMQLGDTVTGETYVMFDSWPASAVTEQSFAMHPRGSSHFGGLVAASSSAKRHAVRAGDDASETITFTSVPALTAGIPVITAVARSLGVPYDTEILLAPTSENMIYRSDPLPADTRYCGIPRVTITVSSNKPQWQVYGFLYDVDAVDIAYIATNTFYTHWGAGGSNATAPVTLRDLPFHTICRTFPAGHRVAVGFVLYSSLFEPANTDGDLSISFHYDAAALTMPLHPQ